MVMVIIMVGSRCRKKERKNIIAGYFSNVDTRVVKTRSRIYADSDGGDDDNGGDHELLPSNIDYALNGPPQQTL